jgi:hypothetical protein
MNNARVTNFFADDKGCADLKEGLNALIAERNALRDKLSAEMEARTTAENQLSADIVGLQAQLAAAMEHTPTGYVHKMMFQQVKEQRDGLRNDLETVTRNMQDIIDTLKERLDDARTERDKARADAEHAKSERNGMHVRNYKEMMQAIKERDRLRDELAQCRSERQREHAIRVRIAGELESWTASAAQFSDGQKFYHSLIKKIGERFGVAAKTSDDGSVQEDVLALRVPELVEAAITERDQLRAQIDANKIIGNTPKQHAPSNALHVMFQEQISRNIIAYEQIARMSDIIVGLKAQITNATSPESVERATALHCKDCGFEWDTFEEEEKQYHRDGVSRVIKSALGEQP